MSLKTIKAILETKLLAISSPLPTQWENVRFEPPVGPYQVADIIPANPDNPTLGGAHYRQRGILQVTLLYPLIVTGSGPAYAKADSVRDWFPQGLSLQSGGITVKIEFTPAIGPKRVSGDRFVLPVSVRWFADIFV